MSNFVTFQRPGAGTEDHQERGQVQGGCQARGTILTILLISISALMFQVNVLEKLQEKDPQGKQ